MPLNAIQQLDEERAVAIDDTVLRYTLPENVPRFDQFQVDEVRVVVVGRTGAGKSATANLLVGCRSPVFETGDVSTSVTHVVREESFFYRGAKVRVMDTPGLFDTDRRTVDVQFEVAKCITEFYEGVHAFILVRNGDGRYTQEEQNSISELKVCPFSWRSIHVILLSIIITSLVS
ncbi:GTPase IMAP family member 9 [Lamellibrachia satsuma]|nr:GTPase IMAP family member 9 [Lamellibrachia satsuma]